jgi:PIN domain nuclease of toxin-antitoxin system
MGDIGYLLDTHTFLWAVRGSKKLSNRVVEIIEDTDNLIYVSAATAYEITNKYRIGKLNDFEDVATNYLRFVERLGVVALPISDQHAHYAGEFEWIHRDPFDRLLAAQAYLEELILLTDDPAFNSISWIKIYW